MWIRATVLILLVLSSILTVAIGVRPVLSAEKGIWVSMDRATASDLLSHARTKKIDVVNARVEHVSYATAKILKST